jgi:PPOX class probable F420-dependent enzyme
MPVVSRPDAHLSKLLATLPTLQQEIVTLRIAVGLSPFPRRSRPEQDCLSRAGDRGDAYAATVAQPFRTGDDPDMDLPDDLLALLRQPSLCFLATSMADGSPHLTQTWVDTDGRHILINSVRGFRKIKNIERDPRVALNVADRRDPARYYVIRGRVLDITTDGAVEHIEKLSYRYTGGPYPWYGGRDQTRLLLTVQADKISSTG